MVVAMWSLAALTACSRSPSEDPASMASKDMKVAPPVAEVAAADPKPGQYQIQACKAAVSMMIGRPVTGMKGSMVEGAIANVSYIREEDGKKWQYRCRSDAPGRLTWATFDAFGDGQQGRWRDEDEIRFAVDGGRMDVTITQDGMVKNDNFVLQALTGLNRS